MGSDLQNNLLNNSLNENEFIIDTITCRFRNHPAMSPFLLVYTEEYSTSTQHVLIRLIEEW